MLGRRHGRTLTVALGVGLVLASVVGLEVVPDDAWAVVCPDLNGLSEVGVSPALWLRADCVNGTGDAQTDGTTFSTWTDLSGNSRNATTVSGKASPTYESGATDLISDKPVMRFTRTSNTAGTILQTGLDIRADVRPDVSIFVVYRTGTHTAGDSAENYGVFGNDNGSWDRFFLATYESGYGNGTADGLISLGPSQSSSSNGRVTSAGTAGATRLLSVVYDGTVSGGANSGPVNGSRVFLSGNVVRSFTDTTHPTAAQTQLFLGWDGDDSAFRGDIAEFIVFETALSTSQIATVNGYLNGRYALSLPPASLPPSWGVTDGDTSTAATADIAFGTRGVAYSQALDVTGGALPIDFSVTTGSLPDGLSIARTADRTVTLSGTPTAAGTYTFSITAADNDASSRAQSFTVVITRLVMRDLVFAYPLASTISLAGPQAIGGGALMAVCLFSSNAAGVSQNASSLRFDTAAIGSAQSSVTVGAATLTLTNDYAYGDFLARGLTAATLQDQFDDAGVITLTRTTGLLSDFYFTVRLIPYWTGTTPTCSTSNGGVVSQTVLVRSLGTSFIDTVPATLS